LGKHVKNWFFQDWFCAPLSSNALAISQNEFYAYLANGKFASLSSWKFVQKSWKIEMKEAKIVCTGICVDENFVFLTFSKMHTIKRYQVSQPHSLKIFGNSKPSKRLGEFNYPTGLIIVSDLLYVCDRANNRVQILFKTNGQYKTQWNGFSTEFPFRYPSSISHYQGLFFIGDDASVSIFTANAIGIQRIGEPTIGARSTYFNIVEGLCVGNDCLYVSDSKNKRICMLRFDYL